MSSDGTPFSYVGKNSTLMAQADGQAVLVIPGVMYLVDVQVAALLADSSAQPSQAERHLMQQNQGLLKFVEQDYKGSHTPLLSLHDLSRSLHCAAPPAYDPCITVCVAKHDHDAGIATHILSGRTAS